MLAADGEQLPFKKARWGTQSADVYAMAEACEPLRADDTLQNAGGFSLHGKVALAVRGGCNFVEKALRAQARRRLLSARLARAKHALPFFRQRIQHRNAEDVASATSSVHAIHVPFD